MASSVARTSDHILAIPGRINTTQEAEYLLQLTLNLWAARQADASTARARFEEALEEFACAEHQLRQAELRAGQARSTVRRSGFGHLLLNESLFPVTIVSENSVDLAQAMSLIKLD